MAAVASATNAAMPLARYLLKGRGCVRTNCATTGRSGCAVAGRSPILLPHLMRAILTKRLTFRGFIVSDFSARYGDFIRDVSAWVREGRIKYREDVVEGLENAPRALIGLLRGENFGKLLVRVAR